MATAAVAQENNVGKICIYSCFNEKKREYSKGNRIPKCQILFLLMGQKQAKRGAC